MTSPGRPSVVARWGRNPVPKIDAILKYGQPSAHVLSYESAADEVDDVAGAREHVADESDPAETAAGDDEDGGDRGDPPVAGQSLRERPDHERQDAREERAAGEVDRDDVEAGHGRGDRAVEVGEPVVGQRHAGEVGHLRREVAGRDARADRDVDQQVAPVPAAARPSHRASRDQPLMPRTARTTRPMAAAMIQAGRSARSAATKPAQVGRWRGASHRWRRATTTRQPSASSAALTMIEPRPNPPTRATTFTRWAET